MTRLSPEGHGQQFPEADLDLIPTGMTHPQVILSNAQVLRWKKQDNGNLSTPETSMSNERSTHA